jgi:hypothetical protein
VSRAESGFAVERSGEAVVVRYIRIARCRFWCLQWESGSRVRRAGHAARGQDFVVFTVQKPSFTPIASRTTQLHAHKIPKHKLAFTLSPVSPIPTPLPTHNLHPPPPIPLLYIYPLNRLFLHQIHLNHLPIAWCTTIRHLLSSIHSTSLLELR